jgi:F5/8 type C domain
MKPGGWLLAFVAVGALVRMALLRAPSIWFDEANTGLMGLAVLRGDFPVYFFGQPFMGALDAYLAAPLYLTFGASVRMLKTLPLVLVLAWMVLTVCLAWQGFGRRAATFTAALLALPPDFLLSWSVEARTHYQLSVALGTLALLLALRVPAGSRRSALVGFGILGVVLGLAFWTNFLSLVFFPSVAILLVRRGVRPVIPGLAIAAAGFTLGSLPHWIYGLQHGTALPPPGGWIGLAGVLENLRAAARMAWPIIAGVPELLRERTAGILLAAALAVLYALVFALAARAVRRGAPRARPVGLALGALVVVNVSVAVGTQYGLRLDDLDQKYLLPVYTALPVLLGGGLAELPRGMGAALAGGLLVVQGLGAMTGTLQSLAPAAIARVEAERQAQLEAIALMEKNGLRRMYAGPGVLTFLSNGRVVVSDQYQEGYLPHARAVDGAEAVGWWLPGSGPGLGETLTALGARFEVRRFGDFGDAFVNFALPPQGLRELDPGTLAVTAGLNATEARSMVDREAATFWSSGQAMRGGEWFQVDLGRVEPVTLIRWLPRVYQEVPAGIMVEASPDSVTWQRLIVLPEYRGPLYWSAGHPVARVRSGRVELRVPPTPARYLRLTQTGQSAPWYWTVRELFVYAAEPAAVPTPPVADPAALARAIRAAGVSHLYADHGWASRIALADPELRVPPANLAIDSYNFRGPESELLPEMRWGPGSGALVEAPDVAGFVRVAHASGLEFRRVDLGGLTLLVYAPPRVPGSPIPASALRVSVSRDRRRAGLAVDGDPRSRWTTGRPQTPGDWLRVDLAGSRMVQAVRLRSTRRTDWPRGVRLEGSADGETWRPLTAEVRSESAVRWGGITLLREELRTVGLEFAPAMLKALRMTLTEGHPRYAWSVNELTVYAAD